MIDVYRHNIFAFRWRARGELGRHPYCKFDDVVVGTHTHTHTHTHTQCDINGHTLASKFTKLSNKLDLVDTDGELCSAEEYQQTKAENKDNIREHLKSTVLGTTF